MRVVKLLLALLLLVSVSHAEVVYQTSFESVPEEGDPQWSDPERVETSDFIFEDTDLSGVSGDWFVLIGNTFVQIPTEVGQTYRLSFKAAVTSSFSLPGWEQGVDLVNEASAYLGTRELPGPDGKTCLVEDLAPLSSATTSFLYPGGRTWRFYEWKSIEMEFVAASNITRLRFRLSNVSNMYVAIDDVRVEKILNAVTRARIGRLKKRQERLEKLLARAQRLDGAVAKELTLRRKLRKLQRELREVQNQS